MRFELGATTFLFGVSWWVLSLSLFASSAVMTQGIDACGDGDTAELIRLHQNATTALYLYPDEREARGCERLDETKTWARDNANDPPMVRNAGKRSKRIEV